MLPTEIIALIHSFATRPDHERLFNEIKRRVASRYVCRLILPVLIRRWGNLQMARNLYCVDGKWSMIKCDCCGVVDHHEQYPRDISNMINELCDIKDESLF